MTTIIPPSAPTRKPSTPGQPWSHSETTALIDAYESKWYSLKRGQLKSHQWDEVAAAVASVCNFPQPSKSAIQCRHKIEKLRKRYRAEKNRPLPSIWPYFDRIDRMERGPVPISVKAPQSESEEIEEEEVEVEEEEEEEEEAYDDLGGGGNDRVRVLMEVANEVRRFGEGMVRMEKRRMEMMREVERDWMDVEAKRAEMVMDAQRSILERIDAAFAAAAVQEKRKKARRAQEGGGAVRFS